MCNKTAISSLKKWKGNQHFDINRKTLKETCPFFNPKKGGGGGICPQLLRTLTVAFWTQLGVYNLRVFFIFGVYDDFRKKNWGVIKFFFRKIHVQNFFSPKILVQKKFILWVFEVFSKPIMFYGEDLNSEWFQLSFDIHIVYVGEKVWIFKNISYEG